MIAPARTGRDRSSRKTVTRRDHTKSGRRLIEIPGARMLKTVVIKFIAPRIDEIPARCRLKITRSTEGPE